MARAILWPNAGLPVAEPAPAPADLLDCPAFAAAYGPELARLMGARITGRLAPLASAAPLLHVGSVALAAPAGLAGIALASPADSLAALLERLFGARAPGGPAAPAGVEALPPGSASWAVLCHTLSHALVRALATAGAKVAAPARHPDRPKALATDASFQLDLDIEGLACVLAVTLEPARPAPQPAAAPEPDPGSWRQRTHARSLDLDLPVALRIAERRIGLAELAGLGAGDILPLERPDQVDVLAGGRRIARLPAASLLPPEGSD